MNLTSPVFRLVLVILQSREDRAKIFKRGNPWDRSLRISADAVHKDAVKSCALSASNVRRIEVAHEHSLRSQAATTLDRELKDLRMRLFNTDVMGIKDKLEVTCKTDTPKLRLNKAQGIRDDPQ